jgi:electron transport complex protein RnfG
MTPVLRETVTTGLALLVFSVVGAALLSGSYTLTRPTIEKSEQAEKLALVAQTLPAGSFDNDLIRDARPLAADPLLGLKRPGLFYPARQSGLATAVVLEAVAPDGYSGEIRLLVGIHADGRVAGVRVTAHKETPGLGDYIDPKKDRNKAAPWIRQFDATGFDKVAAADWKVKKDGGRFDARAGATISARAVTDATRRALQFAIDHRDKLYALPAQSSFGKGTAP